MSRNQRDLPVVMVAGPTASGKSALALALAERLGGTVINADSMQVYSDLRVLTARPSPADEDHVPHALYGFVSGEDAYSAGRFVTDAGGAIRESQEAGRVPILVGGTGLYFKALLEGLSPVPPIPEAIRAHWRHEARRQDATDLHTVLASRDPETAARLNPADAQRIVRALEVWDVTGRSLTDLHREAKTPLLSEAACVRFVVAAERDELYRRCDARVRAMMAAGALNEVRHLAALNLSPELPVMRAVGVPPLLDHLAGHCDLATAILRVQTDTRHYVKRQGTWLRRNMSEWIAIKMEFMEMSIEDCIAYIYTKG